MKNCFSNVTVGTIEKGANMLLYKLNAFLSSSGGRTF
jgi:hypothetical protein